MRERERKIEKKREKKREKWPRFSFFNIPEWCYSKVD